MAAEFKPLTEVILFLVLFVAGLKCGFLAKVYADRTGTIRAQCERLAKDIKGEAD